MSELINEVPQSIQDSLHADQELRGAADRVNREDAARVAGEIATKAAAVGIHIEAPEDPGTVVPVNSQAGIQSVKFRVGQ